MRLVVVGTGYVGLVTGVCLAETGNHVVCVDKDSAKVATLRAGRAPFYEPGLAELLERNTRAGRLRFEERTGESLEGSEIVFIAVGTPPKASGEADLGAVMSVAEEIAGAACRPKLLVVKSTVPVGTTSRIQSLMDERTGGKVMVANNPEFLREGAAISDFDYPDRIVIGTPHAEAAELLKKLYAPFVRTLHPIVVMSRESSEMTKYASNCLLASRISFMNEMANLCRALGADVGEVRKGMGFDSRIGFQYLFPGVGYGGSCFPKDVQAMVHAGRAAGEEVSLLESVHAVNERQKRQMAERVIAHFGGSLKGRRIGVWGVTFKPKTDDVREAPSLVIMRMLAEAGATVRAYDPVGVERGRAWSQATLGDGIEWAASALAAVEEADALVVVTEWNEFRMLDVAALRERMREVVIFDGRNMYDREEMRREGVKHFSIGQADVNV